jgi:hypothetical protein
VTFSLSLHRSPRERLPSSRCIRSAPKKSPLLEDLRAAGAPATALRLLKTDLRPDFIWEFGRHSSGSVEIRAARARCIGGFQLWPMPDAVQHDEATEIGEVPVTWPLSQKIDADHALCGTTQAFAIQDGLLNKGYVLEERLSVHCSRQFRYIESIFLFPVCKRFPKVSLMFNSRKWCSRTSAWVTHRQLSRDYIL